MKATVTVTLKHGVLDPQGKAIEGALHGLGISGVAEVRQGKHFELTLAPMPEAEARATVERLCRDLLANMVIENFTYELEA